MSANAPFDSDEPLLPPGRTLEPDDLRLPAARPEFRAAVAEQTARMVRRRARRRRLARLGQFALAYAAGVLTVVGLWRAAGEPKSQDTTIAVRPPAAAVAAPAAEHGCESWTIKKAKQ